MSAFRQLSEIRLDEWPLLYGRAVAAGCGLVIDPELERVPAADELVAPAVRELISLAPLALLADGLSWPEEWACTVREGAAAVMRLLDRALRAHGRDAGYEIQAWRDHALVDAAALAAVVAMMEPEDRPQSYLVETTGEAIADVIIALHRDRVGVPEALAQALSTMLVIYAANTTEEEREPRDTSPRIEPSP